jgi:hypothetical protein
MNIESVLSDVEGYEEVLKEFYSMKLDNENMENN